MSSGRIQYFLSFGIILGRVFALCCYNIIISDLAVVLTLEQYSLSIYELFMCLDGFLTTSATKWLPLAPGSLQDSREGWNVFPLLPQKEMRGGKFENKQWSLKNNECFCTPGSWEAPLHEETHKWTKVQHVSVANGAATRKTKVFAEQGWLILWKLVEIHIVTHNIDTLPFSNC